MATDGIFKRRCTMRVVTVSSHGSKTRGASMIEFLIVTPLLLLLGLGLVQVGLLFHAKSALNFALQEAARSGAVGHGSIESVRNGLLRGLVPFMGGGSSIEDLAKTLAGATEEFTLGTAQGWIRVEQLSPMPESFTDWQEDAKDDNGNGIKEIPNANLAILRCTREPNDGVAGLRTSTACGASGERIGQNSQQTLADANLLRLQMTYGVKLVVPFINRIVGRALAMANGCIPPERQRVGVLDLGTPGADDSKDNNDAADDGAAEDKAADDDEAADDSGESGGSDEKKRLACAAYYAVDASGHSAPRIPVSLSLTVRMQSTPRSVDDTGWFTVASRGRDANTGGVQLGKGNVDAASQFAPIPVAQLNPNGVSEQNDTAKGTGNGSLYIGGDRDGTKNSCIRHDGAPCGAVCSMDVL
jgi:hypothetical protein